MSDNKKQMRIVRLDIDAETSTTQLFKRYSGSDWSMLLDSADSQHPDANFDILVAEPVATLLCRGQISHICRSGDKPRLESRDDPVALLHTLLQDTLGDVQVSDDLPLPFQAGALGYFGYDLGRRFESLPSQAKNDYKAADMAVGIYSWSLIKDGAAGKFYLCYLPDYPHPEPLELEKLTQPAAVRSSFKLTSDWQANMTETEYSTKFDRIQAYLRAGDCYQVNLAQRFKAKYDGDEWLAYLQLRDANQAPFSAFLRLPNSCILSISPERFLSLKAGRVQSKPIKGTRPRHDDKKRDKAHIDQLQQSEKDRAENLMIVDLLRNDLSRNCQPGSVDVPELFAIESFAAVHHLVSTVVGELKLDSSPLQLLRDAFPGGSITGAPKIRAMQIIDELEPHRRSIYCGSIGYLGVGDDMDTSICIRTLLCEGGSIYCWAGGGIVLDSTADSEYQETLDKVAKILPVLINLKSET